MELNACGREKEKKERAKFVREIIWQREPRESRDGRCCVKNDADCYRIHCTERKYMQSNLSRYVE